MADGQGFPLASGAATLPIGRWRGPLLVLGGALLLLVFAFAEEGMAAVRVWNASTAYNHCWLVAPIAAWLAWQRRHRLAALAPAPLPAAVLLMLPAGCAWLLAERLGIMEGRQLTAMAMLWVLVLAVLGWQVVRAMAAPLVYLVFMVPFGAFAVPALQDITAWIIEVGLSLAGITHFRDGLLIETPAGLFHVAEACAGLRFIIAALAFGALYAFVMYRSPWRRLVVLGLALTVPILANGLRALGIVVLAEYLGSAEAAAADHVIYGWGFFSAIILLLVVAGLPFREDGMPEAPAPRPALPPAALPVRAFAGAAGLAVGLMAAGPVAAAALDRAAGAPRDIPPSPLEAPEGCTAEGHALRCPGATVSVRLLVFPQGVTWGAVASERRRSHAGGSDEDTIFSVSQPGLAAWQARDHGSGATATATWLGGRPVGDGVRTRALQAANSLGLGDGPGGQPVLAVVIVRPDPDLPSGAAGPLLRQMLGTHSGALAAQAAALSAGR